MSNKEYLQKLLMWSKQFSMEDWFKVCERQDFLNCVIEYGKIAEASSIASAVLERKIEPFEMALKQEVE